MNTYQGTVLCEGNSDWFRKCTMRVWNFVKYSIHFGKYENRNIQWLENLMVLFTPCCCWKLFLNSKFRDHLPVMKFTIYFYTCITLEDDTCFLGVLICKNQQVNITLFNTAEAWRQCSRHYDESNNKLLDSTRAWKQPSNTITATSGW